MKIKVLIVDDEKLERILIRKGYDWEGNNFEIIGEASSGQEALTFIETNQPDMILTDINMPYMDGLKLAEQIKNKEYNIKIIIVTGYREFDYARGAMRLGVKDFLLKPININDISETVQRLCKEIEQERQQQQEYIQLKATAYQNRGILNGEYEKINHNKEKRGNHVVNQALDYINENIYNPELTLKVVAQHIFVNESYLSRIFKKEVGENLIGYIIQKRIAKSMQLLSTTDLKVYEIADQIGIRDPHYFSTCFKKQVGVTIKEYRQARLMNE